MQPGSTSLFTSFTLEVPLLKLCGDFERVPKNLDSIPKIQHTIETFFLK